MVVALSVAAVVGAVWQLARTVTYRGRHRARWGRSTDRRAQAGASYVEAQRYLASLAVPAEEVPVDEVPAVVPETIGERQRYGRLHLEPLAVGALNEQARRDRYQVGPLQVVDLRALRVRAAVPTVAEVDDEWLAVAS